MQVKTRYIGIDLAWGERATTAVVILEAEGDAPSQGARFVAVADALTDDDSIVDFVRSFDTGGSLYIGIDAPTLVPNLTGRRPCEAILSRCLRLQQATPHPANRNLLAKSGTVRGERIVAHLSELGIRHTPMVDRDAINERIAFEVFPHPAHVALFGLERTLKYKVKPNRPVKQRLPVYRQYINFLIGLKTGIPPLFLPEDSDSWLRHDPATMTVAGLKRFEDALDALTCAYIALYRYAWGDERCPVVGDLQSGYIVTPATEHMKNCFTAAANEIRTREK